MPQRNDLDLAGEGWRKYKGNIHVGTLRVTGKRGSGGSAHYPGNFIPEIPRNEILRYSKKGDLIADLFAGSETTADVCGQLERIYCGCDLRPQSTSTDCGDARTWDPGCLVQMVFLHPPYADIIDYNEKLGPQPGDLSLPWEAFLTEFATVARNAYRMLAPDGIAVLVMGDLYEKGEHIPLAFYCMEIMKKQAGFKLKSINIKNFGDEVANKGKNENLWYLRALKGGFSVLEHEYIAVFQKLPLRKNPA